jgi:N-acetylglucosamine kinase-like BadF-type ATPase
MKCFLGFDGGGTKTECVVLNDAGAVVARGRGPASNPTRIGVPAALAALQQTYEAVLSSSPTSLEVAALCAGLAGTARAEFREPIVQFLNQQFPTALVDVRSDLEVSLDAMPQGPAIVLVVGTGSAAIGRNDAGTVQREGGFGPATSDEGSAYDIGHAAIATARNENSSDAAAELSRQILRHLGCSNWSEVDARAAGNADAVRSAKPAEPWDVRVSSIKLSTRNCAAKSRRSKSVRSPSSPPKWRLGPHCRLSRAGKERRSDVRR